MVRSARLRGSQRNRIKSGSINKIDDLDVVSLCSVLSHHWPAIVDANQIDDSQSQGRNLCDSIIHLRNRISHEGSGNRLEGEDELHALLSLSKLCVLLSAPDDLIEAIDQDKQQALDNLATQPKKGDSDEEPEKEELKNQMWSHTDFVRSSVEEDGIPLDVLVGDHDETDEIGAALSVSTFVGIDFGTSTTVVSRVYFDKDRKILRSQPIPIPQVDRMGRTIDDHLVSSCISYYSGNVLVGRGAAELKSDLTRGVDTWYSFKMELGVDLGPKYPRSKLDGLDGRPEVRRPQDAAIYFFNYLRRHIEEWVKKEGLPEDIRYAVSVPASFEANQRLDLCRVMHEAGIDVEDSAIIDEPNAAFCSYLLDSLSLGEGIVNRFKERKANVLVFDFGAGTCDISILEMTGKEDRLISRNLAISQFRALGGDNIDRQIARTVLWPEIERNCLSVGQHLRQAQFNQVVLPRLQPVAERLKIQCCKWIASRAQDGDISHYRQSEIEITEEAIKPIKVGDLELKLDKPSITIGRFFSIMNPFIKETTNSSGDSELISVLDPIQSAISKAGIQKDDLTMVLFIGGSAQNPVVQECVKNYMGRFVECVMGEDVRTPVSQGAALHSLVWNGLDFQFIRPITSETIYILAAGGKLHTLVEAGSPIPSPDAVFTDGLVVQNDSQQKIQLPICVSSASKVLHTLELRPQAGQEFCSGDRITVSARLDGNKLLHVKAKLGKIIANGELINPLANSGVTPQEMKRLQARQRLNESSLENGGRPDLDVLERFAEACAECGAHLDAAETFEALFRMNESYQTSNIATKCCYNYSRCGKKELSNKWAEEAYRCEPTWVSAFNLAIGYDEKGDREKMMEYLREAHRLGPSRPTVLSKLGGTLLAEGNKDEGMEMLNKALEIYRSRMQTSEMSRDDLSRAKGVAGNLNNNDFLEELNEFERAMEANDLAYSEENLAVSKQHQTEEG